MKVQNRTLSGISSSRGRAGARHVGVVVAAAVLSAGGLTACGGGGGGNADDFCNAVSDAQAKSPNPSNAEVAVAFRDFADKAPSDIKDDVQTLSDALQDPTNADAEKVQAAGQRLSAWISKNCSGVDIGGLGG